MRIRGRMHGSRNCEFIAHRIQSAHSNYITFSLSLKQSVLCKPSQPVT
jgi:hypothetical protein